MKKYAIIGLGNPLRKDDGVGIVLLEKLQKGNDSSDEHIHYIDGGTGGMSLLPLFSDFDRILFIDAVDMHKKPGAFQLLDYDEMKTKHYSFRHSTHEPNILKVLMIAQQLGEFPKNISFFAIQPKELTFGNNLTSELQDHLDILLRNLKKEIKNFIK